VLSARELLGCALVFAAIIMSQLPWKKWFGKKPISPNTTSAEAAKAEI